MIKIIPIYGKQRCPKINYLIDLAKLSDYVINSSRT